MHAVLARGQSGRFERVAGTRGDLLPRGYAAATRLTQR